MLSVPKREKSSSGTVVSYSGATEAGRVRAINQDSFYVGQVHNALFSHRRRRYGWPQTGEVASQKAVEVIQRELQSAQNYPPAALARAVQAANLEVYDYATETQSIREWGLRSQPFILMIKWVWWAMWGFSSLLST